MWKRGVVEDIRWEFGGSSSSSELCIIIATLVPHGTSAVTREEGYGPRDSAAVQIHTKRIDGARMLPFNP
jgi:hypothetical protein